jgi:hypothetical protein
MRGASPEQRFRIVERRKRVAACYLRGVPQHEIARTEGVNPAQICRDLAAIREEWRASAVRGFDAAKAQELAKIDALEAVAWAAWERSCEDEVTRTASKEKGRATKEGAALPDRRRVLVSKKGQVGDERFLARVAWCIDRRCELLGLDPPKKVEGGGGLGPTFKVYLNFDPDEALCLPGPPPPSQSLPGTAPTTPAAPPAH